MKKKAPLSTKNKTRSASTRLRNALQQIKAVATDLRKDVTEKKNASK